MRIAIAAFATVMMISGAMAQGQTPPPAGSAFCVKGGGKTECKFATMAACQQGLKEMSGGNTKDYTCVPRGQ